MKQKKKNRFFTFMFSFLPGAAEMYMGFMKNGFSLMLFFLMPFALIVIYGGLDFLMPVCAVMWFYGFFHARNLAGLDDQSFAALGDRYIWEEFSDLDFSKVSVKTARKWIAIAFIVIGAALIWDYFSSILYRMIPEGYWDEIYPALRNIPQAVISVLMVTVGIRMIIGKKKELDTTVSTEVKPMADIARIEDKSLDSKEA